MKSLKEFLVSEQTTLRGATEHIDQYGNQIVFIVDASGRLRGSISDGDIRRALLKSLPFTYPAVSIMNENPFTAPAGTPREGILALMKKHRIRHLPLLDPDRRVVAVSIQDEILDGPLNIRENAAVLMAGGLGSRLSPLTESCPKPLLLVGDQPILETILKNLIAHGIRRFYISVNYKAEMIRDYFGDGSRWDVEIEYLHEETRLGTAGGLSLLPALPTRPVIVMNGDLLTKVNFDRLLAFHSEEKAHATMCVRDYEFQVPFGVVETEGSQIVGVNEKPVHKFFVNAGIYVLSPEAIALLQRGENLDMPGLFDRMNEEKMRLRAFPIREYWMDIGRMSDFEQANGEFARIFRPDSIDGRDET